LSLLVRAKPPHELFLAEIVYLGRSLRTKVRDELNTRPSVREDLKENGKGFPNSAQRFDDNTTRGSRRAASLRGEGDRSARQGRKFRKESAGVEPVLLSSTSRGLSGKRRCEAGASLLKVLTRPCTNLDAAQGGRVRCHKPRALGPKAPEAFQLPRRA